MSAARQIQVLSDHVINKIAAGEVVERPASVLKEVVENAVDAGATQIDVEIVAGGRKLVAVRDNGSGMDRDNALLAVERHATSKIRDVDDIEHIDTLGFRGEALAAIASVSRFRLVSALEGAVGGTEILIDGGKLRDVADAGAPTGTTIEVRDLFFNVPARRKFLRSHETELAHVKETFIVTALARPGVGFSLRVDSRELYRLAPGATLPERLGDLFGSDYLRHLRPVAATQAGVRVTGFISLPTQSRADRNEQYVFVNRRAAGAPLLGHALREAYRGLLPENRHPAVFLYLELDPGDVDVNVHPTKREVRFRRPGDVRDAVLYALRTVLASGAGAPAQPPPGPPRALAPPTAHVQLSIADLPSAPPFQYPRPPAPASAGPAPEPSVFPFGPGGAPSPASAGAPPSPSVPPRAADALPCPVGASGGPVGPLTEQAPWAWCRVLGQVAGLYVLLETEDGLVIMDPRAAHERVLYERFMRDIAGNRVQSQSLLLPETVDLGPKDAARVRRHGKRLRELGFGVAEFGGDSFVVDALPSCFAGAPGAALLNEVAHALETAGARGDTHWLETSVAEAASRAAVRGRDRLTLQEIEQLVVDLARAEMPYTCPRGRPTLIFTSFNELGRKFGRT